MADMQAEQKKYSDLQALPSAQEALREKYSQFHPETGDPSHDMHGAALEGKVCCPLQGWRVPPHSRTLRCMAGCHT